MGLMVFEGYMFRVTEPAVHIGLKHHQSHLPSNVLLATNGLMVVEGLYVPRALSRGTYSPQPPSGTFTYLYIASYQLLS